jgi:hypothetical protein
VREVDAVEAVLDGEADVDEGMREVRDEEVGAGCEMEASVSKLGFSERLQATHILSRCAQRHQHGSAARGSAKPSCSTFASRFPSSRTSS